MTEKSCGCIFKNPDPERAGGGQHGGKGAGQLIDELGGKGLERGGALVSPKHGNFIVNRGDACASDVIGLIEELGRLVHDRAGIELELEVKRFGWTPALPWVVAQHQA